MTAPLQETDVQLQDPTEAPAVPGDGLPGAESPVEPQKGNREARYRVERNHARDALSAAETRIEALQLREVERLASDLAQPGDLLSLGDRSLADFLDAAGDVDNAAVAEAVAALIHSRPGLAKHQTHRAIDHSQGLGNDRPGRREPTFSNLLQGR